MRPALRGALFGVGCLAAYLLPLFVLLTAADLVFGPSDGLFGILSLFYTAAFMGAVVRSA